MCRKIVSVPRQPVTETRFPMPLLLMSSIVFCALLLAPCETLAQGTKDLELNVFISGSAHNANRFEIGFPQAIVPVGGKFRFDNAYRTGLRLNVFNSKHWGQEFFYSFESNEANFARRSPPVSTLELGVQIHQLGVNALYYFDEDENRRLRPFITIGLGAAVYRPTDEAKSIARDPLRGNLPAFSEGAELALNYGTGFKHRLGSRVGWRFDMRGFLSRTPNFGLPRQSPNPIEAVFPAGGAIHNLEASGGLIFYLGK